jgi:hypothetical protein
MAQLHHGSAGLQSLLLAELRATDSIAAKYVHAADLGLPQTGTSASVTCR